MTPDIKNFFKELNDEMFEKAKKENVNIVEKVFSSIIISSLKGVDQNLLQNTTDNLNKLSELYRKMIFDNNFDNKKLNIINNFILQGINIMNDLEEK